MIYVLDTDTFSDATRRRRGLRERIERERLSHTVVTTVITRLEMLKGWHERVTKAADAGEVRRAVAGLLASEEFLAEFAVLPFDERAEVHFERLRIDKQAKKAGRSDLLIGCIALANGGQDGHAKSQGFPTHPRLDHRGLVRVNWRYADADQLEHVAHHERQARRPAGGAGNGRGGRTAVDHTRFRATAY